MKLLVIGLVIIASLAFMLPSQSESSDGSSVAEAQSFAAIEESVANNEGILIDVRTPEEYAESYIAGADLLPLQQLQQGAVPDVGTDTTIYLYCRSGNRSVEAADILRNAGYEVVDLGGLQDVTAIGGRLISP